MKERVKKNEKIIIIVIIIVLVALVFLLITLQKFSYNNVEVEQSCDPSIGIVSDDCCSDSLGVASYFSKEQNKCSPLQELYKRVDHGNPATDNCIDNGGVIRKEKDAEGNEIGICMFLDETECEQWDFLNGVCEKG